MHLYYVYQLRIEGCDEPFYIGKGKLDRIDDHFKPSSLKSNSYKNNKIKKALSEGKIIHREFLIKDLTEFESLAWERFYIGIYGRVKDGGCLTNNTEGGEGSSGIVWTEEMKSKRRGEGNPMFGRQKSAEFIAYQHAKGEDHPMFGKRHADDTILAMRKARTGRVWVSHPDTLQSRNVSPEDLQDLLDSGWVRGRLDRTCSNRKEV